jgi:hypothetical protein
VAWAAQPRFGATADWSNDVSKHHRPSRPFPAARLPHSGDRGETVGAAGFDPAEKTIGACRQHSHEMARPDVAKKFVERSCSAQPELARQDEKYTGCSTVSARRGSRVSTRPSRVQRQTSRRRCWWVVVGKWTFVCLGAAKRHIRSSDSRVRDEPVPWFLEGRARISRRSRRCGRSGRSSSS